MTRQARLNSPYGYWRLVDSEGSVLTIPNGVVGYVQQDGTLLCFHGNVALHVPVHWLAPIEVPESALTTP